MIYDQESGAAIGSGQGGSFGDITVNGGTVVSYAEEDVGGAVLGAGQGGSCGNITVNNGSVTAPICYSDAAVIGTGSASSTCGNITINGGDVHAENANSLAGAIIGTGGGGANHCGTITITDSDVYAETAGETAYGIGLGSGTDTCAGVVITGGSVYAAGGAGMTAPQPTNGTEPLYLLQVPNPARGAVYIDGTLWPPTFYTSDMDSLFAWVTGRDHTVRVDQDDVEGTYLFLDGTFVPADSYDWDAAQWEWNSEDGEDGSLTASGPWSSPV